MASAYLLLGGNIGNVPETFKKAKAFLEKKSFVSIKKTSSIYKSVAWGYESENIYYNQVIEIEVDLSAYSLLFQLLEIEIQLGRNRDNEGYSDRTLDLDLLFYNQAILVSDLLDIPHPRLHLRRFTLAPLNEIAPGIVHPITQTTICDLLKNCTDENQVEIV